MENVDAAAGSEVSTPTLPPPPPPPALVEPVKVITNEGEVAEKPPTPEKGGAAPEGAPAEKPAEARPAREVLVLTEVQKLSIEVAQWKHRAMKSKTTLAQKVAEDAAIRENQAYEELLARAASYGVDVSRSFRIDEQGRVTYPIAGRPDFAPPEGKTVKR